ncbi:MAG: hypothetical protein V4697_02020 [Patescibacteria group bacterium]
MSKPKVARTSRGVSSSTIIRLGWGVPRGQILAQVEEFAKSDEFKISNPQMLDRQKNDDSTLLTYILGKDRVSIDELSPKAQASILFAVLCFARNAYSEYFRNTGSSRTIWTHLFNPQDSNFCIHPGNVKMPPSLTRETPFYFEIKDPRDMRFVATQEGVFLWKFDVPKKTNGMSGDFPKKRVRGLRRDYSLGGSFERVTIASLEKLLERHYPYPVHLFFETQKLIENAFTEMNRMMSQVNAARENFHILKKKLSFEH